MAKKFVKQSTKRGAKAPLIQVYSNIGLEWLSEKEIRKQHKQGYIFKITSKSKKSVDKNLFKTVNNDFQKETKAEQRGSQRTPGDVKRHPGGKPGTLESKIKGSVQGRGKTVTAPPVVISEKQLKELRAAIRKPGNKAFSEKYYRGLLKQVQKQRISVDDMIMQVKAKHKDAVIIDITETGATNFYSTADFVEKLDVKKITIIDYNGQKITTTSKSKALNFARDINNKTNEIIEELSKAKSLTLYIKVKPTEKTIYNTRTKKKEVHLTYDYSKATIEGFDQQKAGTNFAKREPIDRETFLYLYNYD